MWERFGLSVMRRMDPERAHALAIAALKTGMLPLPGPVTSPRLATTLAGCTCPTPSGLAAGFDKNAEAIAPLSRTGFGFLEVGGATPRAQAGNERPRLFRLTEDAAAINRFGFNNEGMEVIAARLAEAPDRPRGPQSRRQQGQPRPRPRLRAGADLLRPACGFRDRQRLLAQHRTAARPAGPRGARRAAGRRDGGQRRARDAGADLPQDRAGPRRDGLAEIAEVAETSGIACIIATNTTLSREGLASRHRDEAGGLSGQPLFERSTRVLARLYRLTGGAIPLLGVGGVSTVDQAWEKLRAGASAVQLYTALVYAGITLGARIAEGLDRGWRPRA
jgi:dihydroorotate dehydrogenase